MIDIARPSARSHGTVSGTTADGTPRRRTWHLVATRGNGPFVPTLAAAARFLD